MDTITVSIGDESRTLECKSAVLSSEGEREDMRREREIIDGVPERLVIVRELWLLHVLRVWFAEENEQERYQWPEGVLTVALTVYGTPIAVTCAVTFHEMEMGYVEKNGRRGWGWKEDVTLTVVAVPQMVPAPALAV